MMSVLVEDPDGQATLLTKGAPEEVFHHCSQFELDVEVVADGSGAGGRIERRIREPE